MMRSKKDILLWTPFIIIFFVILSIIALSILNKISITSELLVLLVFLIFLAVFPLSKVVEILGIIKIRKEVRELKKEVDDKFINLQNLIFSLKMSQKISISFEEMAKRYGIEPDEKFIDEKEIRKRIDKIDDETPAYDVDPVVELFKIRYLLEERVRNILVRKGAYNRKMTLNTMTLEIKKRGIVPDQIFNRVMYISNASTGVIHGEEIDYKNIHAILKIGQSVLAYLDKVAEEISVEDV